MTFWPMTLLRSSGLSEFGHSPPPRSKWPKIYYLAVQWATARLAQRTANQAGSITGTYSSTRLSAVRPDLYVVESLINRPVVACLCINSTYPTYKENLYKQYRVMVNWETLTKIVVWILSDNQVDLDIDVLGLQYIIFIDDMFLLIFLVFCYGLRH